MKINFKKIITIFALFVSVLFSYNNVSAYEAKPGEIYGAKNAMIVENSFNRKVDINLSVKANAYDEVSLSDNEIIFVLDVSGSMNEKVGSSKKIDLLKSTAKDLIADILDENKNSVKIGIVYFEETVKGSCELSNDKTTLTNCINDMSADGGTNIQGGIELAKTLFSAKQNTKTMILLTDGEATFYNDANDSSIIHGAGDSDNYEDTSYNDKEGLFDTKYRYYLEASKTTKVKTCQEKLFSPRECTTETKFKPSYNANIEAESFNGEIFTIGFDIKSKSNAENLLKQIARKDENYFLAANAADLATSFKEIISSISLIGTNTKVTDTVPNHFEIDEEYFITNFGTKNVTPEGTYYGDKVLVVYNEDDSFEVNWLIGDLSANVDYDLNFRIIAKDDYYGNIYTNNGAHIEATVADNNPYFQGNQNPILIQLRDQQVNIAMKTKDDIYTVHKGNTLNSSLLFNDSTQKLIIDENTVITNKVITVGSSITVNEDGTFTYIAPTDSNNTITFTYYVETTIDKNGEITKINSNVSTVTINVTNNNVGYKILHVRTDGTIIHETTGNGNEFDTITGNALNLGDYDLIDTVTSKDLVLSDNSEDNVITFTYAYKDSGKVTINYYLEGTTTTVATSDEITGKVNDTHTISPKDLSATGYNYVSGDGVKNITLTLEDMTINYYYSIINGTVTVRYVDAKGNNIIPEEVHEERISTEFNFAAKEFANYNLTDTTGNTTGIYSEDKHTITFTYELKDSGKVTINYYLEGTTTTVATSDEITGKVNDTHTISPKDLSATGYNYVSGDGVKNITLTLEDMTINYYYSIINGTVTVRYVDAKGNNIIPEEVHEERISTEFNFAAKKFSKYNLIDTVGKTVGKYNKKAKTITFTYDFKNSGDLTVNYYLEGTNEKILDSKIIFGKIADKYSVHSKEIYGYKLEKVEGKETGKLTKKDIFINYFYSIINGTVTVKYVDLKGNSILEDKIHTEQIGTEFDFKAIEIENYVFIKAEGNTIGEYSEEENTITFIYTLEETDGVGSGEDNLDSNENNNDNGVSTGVDSNNIAGYVFMFSGLSLLSIVFYKKRMN